MATKQELIAAGQTIMVQIGDHQWNSQILDYACSLARRNNGKLALVKMIPVQHTGWLGTEWGSLNLTDEDRAELNECAATAEDYGVEYSIHYFQYMTYSDALLEAAEHVNANVVFATLPKYLLPWWKRYRVTNLHHQFAQQQRLLIDETDLSTLSDVPEQESVVYQ